jgi:hypothetical protein
VCCKSCATNSDLLPGILQHSELNFAFNRHLKPFIVVGFVVCNIVYIVVMYVAMDIL